MPEPYKPLKRHSISEDFKEIIIQPYGIEVLGCTGGWETLSDWLFGRGNLTRVPGRELVLRNCRIRFEWDA